MHYVGISLVAYTHAEAPGAGIRRRPRSLFDPRAGTLTAPAPLLPPMRGRGLDAAATCHVRAATPASTSATTAAVPPTRNPPTQSAAANTANIDGGTHTRNTPSKHH
ncbi:hypothetical protein SRIMM317S_00389 [Streptomyces rimosus subsp. rimosus]